MVRWAGDLRRCSSAIRAERPRVLLAYFTIVVSLFAVLFTGVWNAKGYPISLGYDYHANAMYMHVLLDEHRLPTKDESAEYRQPPVYYAVGGLAARAGHRIFGWEDAPWADLPEHSYRGAQLLNTAFVFLTALLVLSLARTVSPRSPTVWAAAVAFFAFLPVVPKTAAMIHPEPLNMLLSTAAVWLATRLLGVRSPSRLLLILLVVVLALGLGTRASSIFTAAAIAIAMVVRYASRVDRAALASHARVIAAVLLVAVGAGSWAVAGNHLGNIGNPLHGNGASHAQFFSLPVKSLFQTPYRSYFENAALPETYTEIWGDWIGAFAWSPYAGPPPAGTLAILKDQNWIGVIPTLLALGGYIMLALVALRRRRELLALVLLPPIAIVGYLVRSWEQISPDGDLFKASYILTTAPIWALAFGLAFHRLGRFRLVQIGLGVVLVVFAVLELRFMLYGIRDGNPIF